MADRRKHRGPDPRDHESFSAESASVLRTACGDLSWLLGKGYSIVAAVKLVGDRYALDRRQRKAVERGCCAAQVCERRRSCQVTADAVGQSIAAIDGFNCLIVCESILSGAPVFRGMDGAHRDLAGVHGTWRRVSETHRVLETIGSILKTALRVDWIVDRPVSNSGRLRAQILDVAAAHQAPWNVELVDQADPEIVQRGQAAQTVVASSDGWILDRIDRWLDLPGEFMKTTGSPWIVDLGSPK